LPVLWASPSIVGYGVPEGVFCGEIPRRACESAGTLDDATKDGSES
jgi:hypothetical protein